MSSESERHRWHYRQGLINIEESGYADPCPYCKRKRSSNESARQGHRSNCPAEMAAKCLDSAAKLAEAAPVDKVMERCREWFKSLSKLIEQGPSVDVGAWEHVYLPTLEAIRDNLSEIEDGLAPAPVDPPQGLKEAVDTKEVFESITHVLEAYYEGDSTEDSVARVNKIILAAVQLEYDKLKADLEEQEEICKTLEGFLDQERWYSRNQANGCRIWVEKHNKLQADNEALSGTAKGLADLVAKKQARIEELEGYASYVQKVDYPDFGPISFDAWMMERLESKEADDAE